MKGGFRNTRQLRLALFALLWVFSSNCLADATRFSDTFPALGNSELIASISAGSAYARWELANRLALGSHGLDRDTSAAAAWYSRAASMSYPGGPGFSGLPIGPLRIDRTQPSRPRFAPQALVAASALSGPAPVTIELDGTTSTDDGRIIAWDWNFGNGERASTPQATATFTEPGEYQVALTVLDNTGELGRATQLIRVLAPELQPPATPIPVFPAANADINEGATVTFQWEASTDATTYDFHFFNNREGERGTLPYVLGLDAASVCTDGECAWTTQVELPIASQHAWRVRAVNTAGTSSWSRHTFNVMVPVTDIPEMPELVEPMDNALVESGDITRFRWTPAVGASRYELEVVDDADALNPVVIAATLPATSCTDDLCQLQLTLDLPANQALSWQLRAANAAGETEWQSRLLRLVPTATAEPGMPENVNPAIGAEVVRDTDVTFVWEPAPNATTYEFHVFDGANSAITASATGIDPAASCNSEQCSWTMPVTVPAATNHAWRVRARNSLGASNFTRSLFSVIEAITEPPGLPQPIAPLASAVIEAGDQVSFSWRRAAYATRFDLELINALQPDAEPERAFVPATLCVADICSIDLTVELPAAPNHQWSVRAVNDIDTSEWVSTTFAVFTDASEPPAAPVALAPGLADDVITGTEVPFSWLPVEDASNYDLQLVASNDNSEVTVETERLALNAYAVCEDSVCTQSVLVSLPLGTAHAWRVRAANSQGASDYSTTPLRVVSGEEAVAPQARLSLEGYADNAIGGAPLTLTATASGSTDDVEIVSYLWDWGDGSEPRLALVAEPLAASATHVYAAPGDYTLTLTVTDNDDLTDTASRQIQVVNPNQAVDRVDAARLLTQATFGPNREALDELQLLGMDAWLDQQLALQGDPHLEYVLAHSNGSNRQARHEVWWRDVVEGNDQLRQRMAFALSEIFVVSDIGYSLGNSQYGITRFYDILREHAFGNYRDLLEEVTLSPVMGIYLSMLQNARGTTDGSTRPDENFAREVLQLFSIGLYELNLDGTSTGASTFTQAHVEAYARVFTGWNYANATQWNQPLFTGGDLIAPMEPDEAYHDTGSKTLLGDVVVPAGGSAAEDLALALDSIFNHSNVGPFIGKQLIQRLVTSNPSPGYVSRVASVFNDNGEGTRGDLGAVVRAILTDTEARQPPVDNTFGKLREPVLRLSHLWRAFNITPGNLASNRGEYNTYSPEPYLLDTVTGQAPLKSASVFNFFSPDFAPAGPVLDSGLQAPEFQLFVEATELATSNRIGNQIQRHYAGNASDSERNPSYLDFSFELTLASDTDTLLDHLNLLMLSGGMSDNLRDALSDHLDALPDHASGLSQRVRDAVTLIMASPDYLIQQ